MVGVRQPKGAIRSQTLGGPPPGREGLYLVALRVVVGQGSRQGGELLFRQSGVAPHRAGSTRAQRGMGTGPEQHRFTKGLLGDGGLGRLG